ncbi:MAG: TIGR02466 family protein [Gammaproteobacteria bacterium]
MKLGQIFAVPFAELRLENPEPLARELTELFLRKEAAGDAFRNEVRRDTQHGLFESRFDLFQWRDPPVRQLTKFCHTGVASVLRGVSDYSDAEFNALRFDYHAWFHVTRRGGYQGVHNHPNATWSGIYCVDPGDGLPDRPGSGAVRFHDPRGFADQYMDAGNERLKVSMRHGGFEIHHEVGKLLIFPSYLKHEVFPYEGERPRIVVAFNCWIRTKDSAL